MRDGFLGEQVVLQLTGERGILAPDPLQHHGRMLLLLVSIVDKNGLEGRVLAGICPLVVPIHGFELFHQGNNGSVHVARFSGQLFNGLVISDTRHFMLLWVSACLGGVA